MDVFLISKDLVLFSVLFGAPWNGLETSPEPRLPLRVNLANWREITVPCPLSDNFIYWYEVGRERVLCGMDSEACRMQQPQIWDIGIINDLSAPILWLIKSWLEIFLQLGSVISRIAIHQWEVWLMLLVWLTINWMGLGGPLGNWVRVVFFKIPYLKSFVKYLHLTLRWLYRQPLTWPFFLEGNNSEISSNSILSPSWLYP